MIKKLTSANIVTRKSRLEDEEDLLAAYLERNLVGYRDGRCLWKKITPWPIPSSHRSFPPNPEQHHEEFWPRHHCHVHSDHDDSPTGWTLWQWVSAHNGEPMPADYFHAFAPDRPRRLPLSIKMVQQFHNNIKEMSVSIWFGINWQENREFIRIAKHHPFGKRKDRGRSRKPYPRNSSSYPWKPRKRNSARTLGAPTVRANSFSEKERYEKEHPLKLNDAPSPSWFWFLPLYLWCLFVAISALWTWSQLRQHQGEGGLITLILEVWTGLCSYLMYYFFFYQYMDGTKDRKASVLFGNPCWFCWASCSLGHCLVSYFHFHRLLNPTIPDVSSIVLEL